MLLQNMSGGDKCGAKTEIDLAAQLLYWNWVEQTAYELIVLKRVVWSFGWPTLGRDPN